jgi:hypothetical protein
MFHLILLLYVYIFLPLIIYSITQIIIYNKNISCINEYNIIVILFDVFIFSIFLIYNSYYLSIINFGNIYNLLNKLLLFWYVISLPIYVIFELSDNLIKICTIYYFITLFCKCNKIYLYCNTIKSIYCNTKIKQYNNIKLNNYNDEECCICLIEYKEEDKIRILQCEHYYHKKCIDIWLIKYKEQCPLCRDNIV